MQKKALIVSAIAILAAPLFAAAASIDLKNPLKATELSQIIESITNYVFWLALALVPVMIIWAAFKYVTSAGDPNKVKEAWNIILYAAIGLGVALMSRGLVAVVRGLF